LVGAAPYALPLKHKILPEFLNDLGYKSVAVGKWHLGSHSAKYTPTFRGFASHVGYWTGHKDYYDHTAQEIYGPVVRHIFLRKVFFCKLIFSLIKPAD
jgi:arylsulfatase B